MQNDLISRSALKKTFEAAGFGDHSLIESVLAAGVYAVIDNAPAVDAAPVVHGRWEWYEDWGPSTWLDPPDLNNAGWKCSNCGIDLGDYLTDCLGVTVYVDEEDKMPKIKSCPNCGAKMDGEAE